MSGRIDTPTFDEIRALCTERVLTASPEAVFAAIADPARLARWWGELALLLAPQDGSTRIGWRQTFPSAEDCARMAPAWRRCARRATSRVSIGRQRCGSSLANADARSRSIAADRAGKIVAAVLRQAGNCAGNRPQFVRPGALSGG